MSHFRVMKNVPGMKHKKLFDFNHLLSNTKKHKLLLCDCLATGGIQGRVSTICAILRNLYFCNLGSRK